MTSIGLALRLTFEQTWKSLFRFSGVLFRVNQQTTFKEFLFIDTSLQKFDFKICTPVPGIRTFLDIAASASLSTSAKKGKYQIIRFRHFGRSDVRYNCIFNSDILTVYCFPVYVCTERPINSAKRKYCIKMCNSPMRHTLATVGHVRVRVDFILKSEV